MKICIVGSGTVGCATGRGFSKFGHEVVFFDIDKRKIESLISQGMAATGDLALAARSAEAFFICVPTPTKKKRIDLSIIKSAAESLAKAVAQRNDYFIVVVKSTVVPTTTESVILPLLEEHSGKKAGEGFGLCFNPEFLREKSAYSDFINPDRIIIGQHDKKAGDMLEDIYRPFGCPAIRTDLKTAEFIKYANNCFYSAKISYFNELHLVCQKLGIDSEIVRRAVQMDRFYPTHPWAHGKHFDGKCLPKDLSAFIRFCTDNNIHNPVLLKAVENVNYTIKRAEAKSCGAGG